MQAPEPEAVEPLTTAGWIFMITSLSFVLSLVIWCYRKVLAKAPVEPPKPVRDFHSA